MPDTITHVTATHVFSDTPAALSLTPGNDPKLKILDVGTPIQRAALLPRSGTQNTDQGAPPSIVSFDNSALPRAELHRKRSQSLFDPPISPPLIMRARSLSERPYEDMTLPTINQAPELAELKYQEMPIIEQVPVLIRDQERPSRTIDQAHIVHTATTRLIAQCHPYGFNAPVLLPPDAKWLPAASTLFHRGVDVYRETFDVQRPDWADRTARAIALASTSLASGASPEDIKECFVKQALGYIIDPSEYKLRWEWKEKPVSTEALAYIAQLRFDHSPQRQALNAALDKALPPDAKSRVRPVAGEIVNLMAALATERLDRNYFDKQLSSFLDAYDKRDGAGVTAAIARLYKFDRQWGSPYESSAERWRSKLERLPAHQRKQLLTASQATDWTAVQEGKRQDIQEHPDGWLSNAMLDFVTTPGGVPNARPAYSDPKNVNGAQVKRALFNPQHNEFDKKTFLADLLQAVEVPDGSTPIHEPLVPSADALSRMMPREKPGAFRNTIRWIRSHLPGSTSYRARQTVFNAIERQAAGKVLDAKEWKALERARKDLEKMPDGHTLYARTIQASLAALSDRECLTLLRLTQTRPANSSLGTDYDAMIQHHMAALNDALAREPEVRMAKEMMNVFLAIQSAGHDPSYVASESLQKVWEKLDKPLLDTPSALKMFQLAAERFPAHTSKRRKAIETLGNLTKQRELHELLQKDMKLQVFNAKSASDHALRLTPVFHMITLALMEKRMNF